MIAVPTVIQIKFFNTLLFNNLEIRKKKISKSAVIHFKKTILIWLIVGMLSQDIC